MRLVLILFLSQLVYACLYASQGPSSGLKHTLQDPGTNAQSWAFQGYSVATDGNLVVVGAPFDDTGATDAGVVHVFDATSGVLLHTLTGFPATEQRMFGTDVAISGRRLVVGAPRDSFGTQSPTGRAYAYDLDSPTPDRPVATFSPPEPHNFFNFGWSVSISGSQIAVGTRWTSYTGTNAAAVGFVYDLNRPTPTVPRFTLKDPWQTNAGAHPTVVAISGSHVVVGNRSTRQTHVYNLTSDQPEVAALTLTDPDAQGVVPVADSLALAGSRLVVGIGSIEQTPNPGGYYGRVFVYDLDGARPALPVLTLTNPVALTRNEFGQATAIAGSVVAIGARANSEGIGLAYLYDLAGPTPTSPTFTLTNPIPAPHQFGQSVAVSDTRMVVGAHRASTFGLGAGVAYVYGLANPTSGPVHALSQATTTHGVTFSARVALSGNWCVVGAPGTDGPATGSGAAYVYDLAGETPTAPRFRLRSTSSASMGFFGTGLAMEGSRLVVGAPGKEPGIDQPPDVSVYLFDLEGEAPEVPVMALEKPLPWLDDYFGYALAISGTKVVVGSPYYASGSSDRSGRAYVYDLAGATPSQPLLWLTNVSGHMMARFGFSVAVRGNRVLVGAPGGQGYNGTAHLYDLLGAVPQVPVLTLTNLGPMGSYLFGHSVALNEDIAAVGSPGETDASGNRWVGAVYLYDLGSPTPAVPFLKLRDPTPASNDLFGICVSFSGSRLLVGASGNFTEITNSGSVYVYDLASPVPTTPLATFHNPTRGAYEAFGESLAIDGTSLVAGAPNCDTNGNNRGSAYVYSVGPKLRITPAQPGQVNISWTPTNAPGFVLLYRDGLESTNWLKFPGGAANPVTAPATNTQRFYQFGQP